MPDYKEMYLTMTRAMEKAIRIIIEAQQVCEELYLSDGEPSQSLPENSLTQMLESDIV